MASVLLMATYSQALTSFVAPFARFLQARGYGVTLAASDEVLTAPSTIDDLRHDGFETLVIPFTNRPAPFQDLRAMATLWRMLRRRTFDIVHTYTAKAGVLGRVTARAAGVKVVAHTAFSFPHLDMPDKAWLYGPLERVATRLCDHLFCISDLGYQQAQQLGARPRRGVSNPGIGLDVSAFRQLDEPASIRHRLGLPESAPLIGTAGRLVPHKRIDRFLEIASLVAAKRSDVRFAVLGDGPLRASLVARAEELGVSSRTQFLGYLDRAEDVTAYFRALDAFVLPTEREGFGMVFAEAMAAGTPVVGPRRAPIDGIVVDGQTGCLVDPEDTAAYASAVLRLVEQPDERRRLGQQGRQRVFDRFDEQRSFEAIEATYRTLLSASS